MCLICEEITKFKTIAEMIDHYIKHPEDVLVRYGMTKLFLLRYKSDCGVKQLERYSRNVDVRKRQNVTEAIQKITIHSKSLAHQPQSNLGPSFMKTLQ